MQKILNRIIQGISFDKNPHLYQEDDEKFAKKLINAKKEYANIGDDEDIYILYDDTVFSSGSVGFIITSTSLYTNKIDKNGIEIQNIKKFYVTDPIKRKIMIRSSDGLEKGYIDFNIKGDKDIPPYLDLLNKYLLILQMINSLDEDTSSEDTLIDTAFNIIDAAEDGATDDELITIFQTQFNLPQAPNYKAIYAQKIASGEIDPTEVSFAEFEKTFIKEHMKKLYSMKIASGEIDPTEVSFAEFVDSLQPKVDMKKLYSDKIASGEIDPTEISFAEFSSRANEKKPETTQKSGASRDMCILIVSINEDKMDEARLEAANELEYDVETTNDNEQKDIKVNALSKAIETNIMGDLVYYFYKHTCMEEDENGDEIEIGNMETYIKCGEIFVKADELVSGENKVALDSIAMDEIIGVYFIYDKNVEVEEDYFIELSEQCADSCDRITYLHKNDDDTYVYQAYSSGDYDTGYFSHGENELYVSTSEEFPFKEFIVDKSIVQGFKD